MNPLRLVFMGTPEIAVPALRSLQNAGHKILAVYCQPSKPAGRGKIVRNSPVQNEAERFGITIRTPKTLRNVEEQQFLRNLNLDVIIVVAYGLILPQEVLDIPRLGCFNIHFSLLPRWRGASPVQHAILAGDKETGVCIMQMDTGLDTGDIILCKKLAIEPTATTKKLLSELSEIGAKLIVEALEGLINGTIRPQPQSKEGLTLAPRLTRTDGLIDWQKPAIFIERQVRALVPWPGTYFELNGEKIKVLQAEVIEEKNGEPGTLLDKDFTIACGEQALRIVQGQREGKNKVSGAELLRGLRLPIGYILR